MFKGLRFFCSSAFGFFRAASKQPPKLHLLKPHPENHPLEVRFFVKLLIKLSEHCNNDYACFSIINKSDRGVSTFCALAWVIVLFFIGYV